MTAELLNSGRFSWRGERNEEGHRTYYVKSKVKTTDFDDGPKTVMACSGLPTIGSTWSGAYFGNDSDTVAYCTPYMKIDILSEKEGDKNKYWTVEQKFTTMPLKRCADEEIEDPLLEPQKVSGSFTKFTKEVAYDRHGDIIRNSAHQPFAGQIVEFDDNRPTVRIQQNVASLGLELFTEMVDTVNNATLWGLSARKIKLSNVSWERQVRGVCDYYYTRTFDFEINFQTFDKRALDKGTKALNGYFHPSTGLWTLRNINGNPPDPWNPTHFCTIKDLQGENIECLLNGAGEPIQDANGPGTGTGTSGDSPYYYTIEYYNETNFLLLGIPTSL